MTLCWIIGHSFWIGLVFITFVAFEHNIDDNQNLAAEELIYNHCTAISKHVVALHPEATAGQLHNILKPVNVNNKRHKFICNVKS